MFFCMPVPPVCALQMAQNVTCSVVVVVQLKFPLSAQLTFGWLRPSAVVFCWVQNVELNKAVRRTTVRPRHDKLSVIVLNGQSPEYLFRCIPPSMGFPGVDTFHYCVQGGV